MKTENFSRGIVPVLTASVLVMSMVLVIAPASAGGFIGTNYSGQVIRVIPGGTFVLRTELVWDEPEFYGYYKVVIVWEDNNRADENFTVLYTRAFFDNDGDNDPGPSPVWLENTTQLASGPGTNGRRWAFRVLTTTSDSRDGYFDVEIYMQAGSRGIPHILTDNHPINKPGWGGVIYWSEPSFGSYTPAVTTIRVVTWSGSATFRLENLYKINLYKDLLLSDGRKLVVKFYTYDNIFENENVLHENFTLPWKVVPENENVPHPSGISVKRARLDLTGDNTENVISTIATFVANRDILWARLTQISGEWPFASSSERDALWKELGDLSAQWPYAPS